ncbi:MAG: hypothetical protein KDA92_25890 [Planctomycetales bacterium]|nr:hypothetical protein [Planctomycetales bacterium]MCA9168119.1 hypothetical protein [Planctomycetales bacterium]
MKISRSRARRLRWAAAFLVGAMASPWLPVATNQQAWGISVKAANLQETLEKGLRARRPEEFAFLERVILQVDQGQLPLDLVRSTFDWARHKRPYPYVYFERAIKIRAARIGVDVH